MSNTRVIPCAIAVAGVLFIDSQAMAQAGPPLPGPQPSLIEFDAPGASTMVSQVCAPYCGTTAFDNNDLGDIVGTYTDQNIVPHGFLRRPNGQFFSFDAPGAGLGPGLDQGTVAYAINNLGEIAGQFQDQNYVYHGFVRYPNGAFTTFEEPSPGTQGTIAWDINRGGTTAGIYIGADNLQHGFIRSPANIFTSFDPKGSVLTYPCEETCLTPDGTVAGFYYDSSGLALGLAHGFVRSPSGAITTIDAPNASSTIVASINTKGVIAGYFTDHNNVNHGFVRYSDGSFTTVDAPEAGPMGTILFSINLAGATTGLYVDANGNGLGFERFPDGHFANFAAPGTFTRPSTNNVEGEVAGWYVDAGGSNHGFVWQPSASTARASD